MCVCVCMYESIYIFYDVWQHLPQLLPPGGWLDAPRSLQLPLVQRGAAVRPAATSGAHRPACGAAHVATV